jgi:hypothetical protein
VMIIHVHVYLMMIVPLLLICHDGDKMNKRVDKDNSVYNWNWDSPDHRYIFILSYITAEGVAYPSSSVQLPVLRRHSNFPIVAQDYHRSQFALYSTSPRASCRSTTRHPLPDPAVPEDLSRFLHPVERDLFGRQTPSHPNYHRRIIP